MASSTDNVKLGVCGVFFDGVDLGYTKGGVEVEVQTNTHEVKVDQFGETPINEIITGRMVTVKVPLAETTLDNLVATMPGATLLSDGVKATGTVTFSTAAPVNTDSITLAGQAFVFKTVPVAGTTDMAIPATFTAAATALALAINTYSGSHSATAAAGVVTITARKRGVEGNAALLKTATTPANISVSGALLTGGTAGTVERVDVTVGSNTSLLALAKVLKLRPIGTTGAEDFIVYKTACPGALNFSYKQDNERVFTANFKGYPDSTGRLFAVGDALAV